MTILPLRDLRQLGTMARTCPSWSIWTSLVLRAVTVVLLFVSLGYVIYCSVKFDLDVTAGYAIVHPILLRHRILTIRYTNLP